MKPSLVLVSIFFLCFSTIFCSQAIVIMKGLGVSTNSVDGYLDVKPLEKLGLSVVISERSNRAYVIYGRKIIVAEGDGRLSVDFLESYENAALVKKDTVLIQAQILSRILGLSTYLTPNGNTVLADSLPVIKSVHFGENSLQFVFDGIVLEQMFKISTFPGKVQIEVAPCRVQVTSIEKVKLKVDEVKAIFEIEVEDDVDLSVSTVFEPSAVVVKLRYPGFAKERIAPGILWEQVVETIAGKQMLVNYLWIDPKRVDLRPTISVGGIGTTESIDRMVSRVKAVAGINANYFDVSTRMPIGLIIVDGKVLSLPYGNRPVFIQTQSGEVYISRMFYEVNIKIGQLLFLVKGINTVAIGDVLIFTEEFGLPIPRRDETIYFTVQNGRISSIGWVEKAPAKGYVLAISAKYANYLQAVQIGDRVEVIVNTDFPYPIKHAVEGGPLLIYNGSPLPDRNAEKNRYGGGIATSNANRTLVATLPDGRVVFVVINDQDGSGGVNYDELVEFCLQKGFYSAMNLDGGSSSVMVVKNQIVSRMFSGWVRNIPVSLLAIPKE
ncbi:phosphodiester glycosidase family protein [Pseudothermotoga thermarum]|uniref:Phosphodiester glycosidase domain-containing protein n=1 Tax=Pseudothermotoga thermarum DSM 5069 TaxID=688269 RepID=F7YXM0_9THEM|nr:phosphodiester glycosidase family protein [Pseudothermotoga thermarum]AEH50662.1 hypothetical protein Theth_0574 [Pseudothermotoga thermarum DSM 5069]